MMMSDVAVPALYVLVIGHFYKSKLFPDLIRLMNQIGVSRREKRVKTICKYLRQVSEQ